MVIDLLNFKFAKKLGSANRKPTNYKSANHKNGVRKSQIRKVLHLRKVRKSLNYLSPQICGFASYGTYLQTPRH